MALIQQEPQGLDSFSEGLASFQQEEIQQVTEPTAAVESASLDIKPKKKVTIIEEPIKQVKSPSQQPKSSDMMSKLQTYYYDNQMIVLSIITLIIAYYFYKKNSK